MPTDATWTGNDATTPGDASVAGNWTSTPVATDNVRFVAFYANSVTASLNYLAPATLGQVVVEPGYSGVLGTVVDYLQLTVTGFEFNGSGNAAIDLQASAVDAIIHGTDQSSPTGLRGLYLKGSALSSLIVQGGRVGLAFNHGETSTVTTVRVLAGDLVCGEGVSLTTVEVYGGQVELRSNVATLKVYGGNVVLGEDCDVTALTLESGFVSSIGKGDITTCTINGGVLDMRGGVSRTIGTLTINPGGAINYDPNAITLSTQNEPDAPISISTSPR